jgi:hypothetical protein
MSIGIKVEHLVAHIHTQNDLAESLIKRLQLIARPLLMKYNLPSFVWGHIILHAVALIRLRSTISHKFSHYDWSLEENQTCPILKILVVLCMF